MTRAIISVSYWHIPLVWLRTMLCSSAARDLDLRTELSG